MDAPVRGAGPARSQGLRIFGFPLDVRPGFVILLGLFVLLYSGQGQGELGVWLALSVGGFTLLHELGHAFAARATGAEASIALDFLAGYAAFEPTRPLKRWERAGISLSGPVVQIAVGLGVLAAMGVNPFDRRDVGDTAASLAIWFAGPVLGLINLAPILPLDGGNVVMTAVDVVLPGRSRVVMIWFSIVATIGALIFFTVSDVRVVSPLFLVFPLVVQLQMLQHRHTQQALDQYGSWKRWAESAERDAWTTGNPGRFPPGMTASPWFRAAVQAREGRYEDARRILVTDFAHSGSPNWLPPDAASDREVEALIGLLPTPYPTGNAYSEFVLASELLRLGRFEEGGMYAAASYARQPATMMAVLVAQGAAALGDDDLAVQWLRAAGSIGTNPSGLAEAIDGRPEFARLRLRPEVVALRHQLATAA